MADLTFEELSILAAASETLGLVQRDLGAHHRTGQAKVLHKLQQDVGVIIARTQPDYNPKANASIVKHERDFAPVTKSRVSIALQEAYNLAAKETQYEMLDLIGKLGVAPLPTAQARKYKPPM